VIARTDAIQEGTLVPARARTAFITTCRDAALIRQPVLASCWIRRLSSVDLLALKSLATTLAGSAVTSAAVLGLLVQRRTGYQRRRASEVQTARLNRSQ
jgi:hypothetical protein